MSPVIKKVKDLCCLFMEFQNLSCLLGFFPCILWWMFKSFCWWGRVANKIKMTYAHACAASTLCWQDLEISQPNFFYFKILKQASKNLDLTLIKVFVQPMQLLEVWHHPANLKMFQIVENSPPRKSIHISGHEWLIKIPLLSFQFLDNFVAENTASIEDG